MALASFALFNIIFAPLGFAKNPPVTYQLQGLNQDLMSPVQDDLNRSLRALVHPSSEDIQFWYHHFTYDIKQALEAYGYFKPIIRHSLKKVDASWNANFQGSVGPPLKITSLKILGSVVN